MAAKEKKAKAAKVKKPNKVLKFFRDLISETKKISWPAWKTVVNNTIVVIVAILVIGVFIWLLDALLAFLLGLLLNA
ncbi:MAG: preprotein translocase subunit SecE [Oscillospiraceae bacterium]|nr:preprotein translocase subunit SecE [Oscillospiraceae bacterium]